MFARTIHIRLLLLIHYSNNNYKNGASNHNYFTNVILVTNIKHFFLSDNKLLIWLLGRKKLTLFSSLIR